MDPPQKSPAKPPLITPSASPPPRTSLFSHAHDIFPNVPPPLKRQRLASTPHQASHDSSTSRPQSPADVQMEREASKLRLLDVWSSLAERYIRRLDEDDIVDIISGEITQDRGFIRNSRKVDFGAIAAPVAGDVTVDEGTDEDDEDDEDVYELDELDAFADTTSKTDNAQESDIGLSVRPAPQVSPLDLANAEDLRAFLEAEQRIKQLCGGEVEEDDHSDSEKQGQGSEVEGERAVGFEDLDSSLLNDAADTSETEPGGLYMDSASEDELDNWDVDESSVVYPVLKQGDNDSDIEIIDEPKSLSLKSTQKLNLQVANESQTHQEQLHTPPLSHSLSVLSVTPSQDHFVDASSNPPSSPSCPIQTSSPGGKRAPSVPLSTKYASIKTDLGNIPGPRLDLTQISKVKKSARNQSTSHKSPLPTSNIRKSSVKPYVLLTPRKSTGLANSKTEKQSVDKGKELDVFKDSNPRKAVKKGKAKVKADELFETIITATPTTSEDRKVCGTNKVTERRRRNSSESKAHSEDPLTVIPSQVDSPPWIDKRRSASISPSKPHSVNILKDGQYETLLGGSRSPRPSGSFSRDITGRQSPVPRKRKRVCSDSGTDFAVETLAMLREAKSERHFTPRSTSSSDDLSSHQNQTSTSYMILSELNKYTYFQRQILNLDILDEKAVKPKSTRRSSSRSRRPRQTPKSSISGSGSDSGNSSDGEKKYSYKPVRSHYHSFHLPRHYHYPHHQSYTPSPHRKQQYHPPPPEIFAPMPDPRAQFIITQAMQQLSALVGTPWTPPHDSSSIPYTPSRRHQSRRANSIFDTPSYHPHPYPYSYDPNLSRATLPPESPELVSSPEKSSHGPRKSSMVRSRSRGRRVSFKIDDDESDDGDGGRGVDGYSSPSHIPSSRHKVDREQGRRTTTTEGKGKARAKTPNSESGPEDPLDYGNDRGGKSYPRGRTPGPSVGPPKGMKHGQYSKGRLKST